MASATSLQNLKPNIGLYTTPSPENRIYTAPCSPAVTPELQAEIPAGHVLVHIRSTGICGSDIHFWKHGCIGPTMKVTEDHILGHESAGEVIAVSPLGGTELKVGDRVAVEPTIPCGACEKCWGGRYNLCPDVRFRSTPPIAGLLRRYLIHPAGRCFKLPKNLSYEDGALLEPISVAVTAVKRAGVKLGSRTLICGAGPIGLITLLCARAGGADTVVITDVDQSRLELAKKLVAGKPGKVETVLVSPGESTETVVENILKAGNGEPEIVLECTGVESSIRAGIVAVETGGTVFIVGVGKEEQNFPFMLLSAKEIDVKFQYRYANTWPVAIRLMETGVLGDDVRSLVTHRFELENAVGAFEKVAEKNSGAVKVMIQDLN